MTTPLGEVTSWTFNAQGRPTRVDLPTGASELITYGADGQPDTHTLGDGTALSFIHDAAGRETSRSAGTASRTMTYGPGSRLERVDEPTGAVEYGHDAAGRLSRVSTPAGAPSAVTAVEYGHDVLGRTTGVTVVVGATRREASYVYDTAGNLTELTDPLGGVTAFTYDAAGRLERRTLPTGVVSTWTYDLRDRVVDVRHEEPVSGSTLARRTYARSFSGEPTRIDREDGSYVEVGYDAALRVVSELHRDAGGAAEASYAFTHDADGRRTSRTLDGVTEDYAYLAGARLSGIDVGGAPSVGFGYDGQGRVTSLSRGGADYTLSYDALLSDDGGYVTRIDDGVLPLATYVFDGEGRRERVAHGGVSRRVLWAPAMGGGLESVHAVVDDAGIAVATYVYAGEHPLMRIDASGAATYYLRDAMESVVAIGDETGAAVARFAYDGFGNVRRATGSAAALGADTLGDFRFQGMWLDATGLYFVRARTYDPETGRFLSRDPAEGVLQRPETFAPYGFANGNAFLWSDPTGRTLLAKIAAVSAAQTALALTAAATLVCSASLVASFGVSLSGGVLPVGPCIAQSKKKRDRWTCTAQGNVQQIVPGADCPPRVTGAATGPDESGTCTAAKRVATQSTPRGCYPRHLQCRCRRR